ncbi:MAG: hypothetical protein ACREJ9_06245 [Candidatus Rokuibacteriota bacterium]
MVIAEERRAVGLARAFTRVVWTDWTVPQRPCRDPEQHLAAAIAWLKRAHDQSGDGGVSYGYSLKGGWRPSYRETSGYIAVTFLDLAQHLGDDDARVRARRIGRWLRDVQNLDGSFSNPRYHERGIVFDTGQVLSGLLRAGQETRYHSLLEAARRAADWLVGVADADGVWRHHDHLGVVHVYNTRVAWPLLALNALEPRPERERIARANLEWALGQQRNGWFEHCGFEAGALPFTHTIAYTLRGLLESAVLLKESRYLDGAVRGAEAVLGHLRPDGFLPGRIGLDGRARGRFACLTGNAQMATVWFRLFELTSERRFRAAAWASLRYVMASQDLTTADPDVRGGIKGSQPIWGGYAPFTYPNWATKFFIDALLLWRKVAS